MNENRFPYLLIDPPKQEDSDYFINNYTFTHQKFEKFKTKEINSENGNKILEKTENRVKNLLSVFRKNIELDRNFTDFNEGKSCHKINNINSIKKKEDNKKKYFINNHRDKNKNHKNIYNNHKNKDIFDNSQNGKNSSNKNVYFKNNNKTIRTNKFKEKLNDMIKKARSFGERIINKNKNNEREKNLKKNNKKNNLNINKEFGSLIKKNKSFHQNNNYINFKDNNILYNNNDKEEIIFKMFKKNSELLNDSNHNSMLSDYSDIHLKKKLIDIDDNYKMYEFKLNENKNKANIVNNKKPSNKAIRSRFFKKKESYNSSNSSKKNSKLKSDINPEQKSNSKKSMNFQINTNDFKKYDTTKLKRKPFLVFKALRTDTNFKVLKEQLKQALTLHPEELDYLPKYSTFKTLKKNDNNNSFKVINNRKDSELGYSYKSPDIGLTKECNKGIKNESNNNNRNEEFKLLPGKKESQKGLKAEEEKTNDSRKNLSISKGSKRKSISTEDKLRILTHKSNLYDSLDDEELEDEEEINYLFIEPNSLFSIIFDSILFFFSIVSFIEIPLYLAINQNFCRDFSLISLINYIIDFLNIIDLFLGFFRAFYNWDEQLITKRKFIVLNYISGWFFFDLLSSVPVYTIIKFNEKSCYNKKELTSNYIDAILNNNHYLFILNKIFKILKIFLNNQAWSIFSNKINEKWNIIIIIFLVFSSINYISCMYIFIGRNSFPNWIFHTKLNNESFLNIYITAIYIIIMALTTVGYGDITCYSFSELIFQILILNIGIFGYSWVVSNISNYMQKINGKSAEIEKKLSILDGIKRNNPNFPNDLYERIVRHLKSNNFNKINLKNIIFDSIPIGLKNSLISEMYKPIIKNFIFFKNFQNIDFIIRVIMAFKPIIAYRNDILLNEGDMVEDMMFVKNGILALELVINMDNPQENIKKYYIENRLSIDPLENSILFQEKLNNNNTNLLSYIKEQDSNKNNKYLYNSSTILRYLSLNKYNSLVSLKKKGKREKEKTELKMNKNLIYVKIILIRQNEHFGDVLMFLEKKSPLRVRVKSKKCELFFLKKTDAINISARYPILWKRINKRSVYNFEQMQKNINKIVELYCSVENKKSDKKQTIKEDTIHKKKIKQKKTKKGCKTKIDILSTPINKKISLRKSKSFQNMKNNPEKLEFEKQMNEIKKNIRKYSSMKKLKIYYNNLHKTSNLILSSSKLSSSSLSSIHSSFKKSKNENLININNKQQTNNYDIKLMKDPDYSNRIKFSLITKNKNTNSELNLKNSENSNISGENKEDSTHYDLYEANEELKPGEVIELYNGENLLCKKIDFEKISTKNNFELNNKYVYKNKKTQKLLNSFIDENDDLSLKNKYIDNSKEKNINQNESQKHYSISKNKNENILNKNNCSSFQSDVYSERNNNIYSSIIYNSNDKSPKRSWNKFLIINNNNSFQINSSYENFNLISQNKLIEDNTLQIKMKNYLLSQIRFLQKNNNISNKFSRFKSLENIKGNNYYYKKDFQNTIITKNKRKSNDNSIKTAKIKDSFSSEKSIDIQSNKAKIKNRLSLIQINKENDKKSFSQKYLLEKIINTETNINEDNKLLKEFQYKKVVTLNPIPNITRHKTRRRRGSILDKINFNMQKRNQNLNNPDVFYSHYFNSIIIGELSQKQNNNNNIVADSPPINGKLKSSNEKSINKNS